MEATLPLDRMSREEKLRAMEALWVDLCRDESQVDSPVWHGEVLKERKARVEAGQEQFMDWEAAKDQLRRKRK